MPRELSSDLKAAGLVVVRKLGGITDGDLADVPITADVSTDCLRGFAKLQEFQKSKKKL